MVKKLVKCYSNCLLPPPIIGKNNKTDIDQHGIKQILCDIGPLTLLRWPLQKVFKFEPSIRRGSKLKMIPQTKFFLEISIPLIEY